MGESAANEDGRRDGDEPPRPDGGVSSGQVSGDSVADQSADATGTESERESEGSDDPPERRKFTQRMPEPLVADVDEFASAHGMSRNAAINLLAKTGLDRLG